MKSLSIFVTFLVGFVMALGFGYAGIVRPEVIVGFLDVTGDWSPSIMLVMGAAISLTLLAYRLTFRRDKPLLGARFMVPTRTDIDARLVGGAVLFGAGWGLTGYCPGPALASMVTGSMPVYAFLAAMVGGMMLFSAYERVRQAVEARRAEAEAEEESTQENQPMTDGAPAQ